jgi:hypothetical protein
LGQGVTFRSLTPHGHDLADQYREAKAAEEGQKWISASEAVKLLKPALKGSYSAQMRICARAHAGLIHARADRFMMDERSEDNFEIPKEFWWAEGHEALKQDWEAGDFDTWLNQKHHLRAFGVSFLRAEIEKLVPAAVAEPRTPPSPASAVGGRPPADWWDDLWVEICRQIYTGELVPKRQADIQKAMQQWCSDKGHSDAASTIRPRASKLWNAVFAKGEN